MRTKSRICIYPCYVAYMNAMRNKSLSKHARYELKVSDKTKRCSTQVRYMFDKTKGCSILLKDVRFNSKMFDLKDTEIKDEEGEMILQNKK